MVAITAAAAAAIVVTVTTAATAVFFRKTLFYDRGEHIHFVIISGEELFHLAVDYDLHDVNIVLMAIALFVLTLTVGKLGEIHQYGVLLIFMLEIIDHIQFKFIAIVINEYDDIPFFVQGWHHLSK